jgi:hypothetical protein
MQHLHARLPRIQHPLFLSVAAAALALGACHGSVHTDPPPPPPPPPPVYYEGEPNDTAWLAPWFGALFPGDVIFVEGFTTDDGSDPQDGLAFSCTGPARIDFTLYVDDPWTDLDVWLFDPYLNQFVAAFAVPYGNEKGTFWLPDAEEFHLVVVPSWGASNWTLAVESSTTSYAAALAPDALPELPANLAEYAAAPAEDADVADDAGSNLRRAAPADDAR